MNNEMESWSRTVYELIPGQPVTCTLHLGWVLHYKFQNSLFKQAVNKAHLVARGNYQPLGIDSRES